MKKMQSIQQSCVPNFHFCDLRPSLRPSASVGDNSPKLEYPRVKSAMLKSNPEIECGSIHRYFYL